MVDLALCLMPPWAQPDGTEPGPPDSVIAPCGKCGAEVSWADVVAGRSPIAVLPLWREDWIWERLAHRPGRLLMRVCAGCAARYPREVSRG